MKTIGIPLENKASCIDMGHQVKLANAKFLYFANDTLYYEVKIN